MDIVPDFTNRLLRWRKFDPAWLIELAKEQYPDDAKLHEAIAECTKIKGSYFVAPSARVKTDPQWQYKRRVNLVQPLGECVISLEILKNERIGSLSYVWMLTRDSLLKMDVEGMLSRLTSRDTHEVWGASCEIISVSQDRKRVIPFAKSLSKIKRKTEGLDMGGLLAPNKRFVDFAIRVIEFHKNETSCPCCLYLEHGVDPNKEMKKENITITETIHIDGNWVDYYQVKCCNCDEAYKVIEREHHFMWWQWTRAE